MILQALNEYYLRKMADPDPTKRLPIFGFENKEIPFILDLTADGKLAGIKDTRSGEGKKKVTTQGRPFVAGDDGPRGQPCSDSCGQLGKLQRAQRWLAVMNRCSNFEGRVDLWITRWKMTIDQETVRV